MSARGPTPRSAALAPAIRSAASSSANCGSSARSGGPTGSEARRHDARRRYGRRPAGSEPEDFAIMIVGDPVQTYLDPDYQQTVIVPSREMLAGQGSARSSAAPAKFSIWRRASARSCSSAWLRWTTRTSPRCRRDGERARAGFSERFWGRLKCGKAFLAQAPEAAARLLGVYLRPPSLTVCSAIIISSLVGITKTPSATPWR